MGAAAPTSSPVDGALLQRLRARLLPLDGHDGLVHLIGEARLALIGEASHGTHEFYAERAASPAA